MPFLLFCKLFWSCRHIIVLVGLAILLPQTLFAQIDIEKNIPLSPAATRSSAEESQGYLSDENLLIVEVFVERFGTGENIEIFQHEGGFFVPLGYLASVLEFPVKIDSSSGEASGWFIRENRIFDLNLARAEVVVEGQKRTFDPALAHVYYGDIYVDQSLFSDWFPIDLELRFSDLVLVLKPKEKLPFQERLAREKARGRVSQIVREKTLYPRKPTPYKAISEPFIGVNMGYDYANNVDEVGGHNTPYSVQMSGDLAYMNANFFASGDARSGVQGLRTTLSRKDYDGQLFGMNHLSQLEIGDINGTSIPMVARSSRGRGVSFSNHALQRGNRFDSRDFIGDAIPGWDVELYRNGVLLDSQIVPDTGRYEFLDVPVLFGNNSFRLVFYGPQGEIKEETENYVIDDAFAAPGEFLYEFAVDEKSKTLFGLEERNQNILHDDRIRTSTNLAYGLTERTTLTGGLLSTPLEDGQQHHYIQSGIRQSLGGVLAEVNGAFDTKDEGAALQMTIATSVRDISIRAEQQFLDDFVSEVHSATGQQSESLTALDVDGVVASLFPSGLSYNFSGEYEKLEGNNTNNTTLSNRLSTSLQGVLISHSLNWQLNRVVGNVSNNTTGDISLRGRWMETLIRPTLTYEINPETELSTASISAQRNLTKTLNVRADLRKDLQGAKLTSLTTALTKDFDKYRLSTSFQGNDDGDITVGMNLSFALGREPRKKDLHIDRRDFSSTGAVSARAFLDKNHNQVFDGNDEVLKGVGFRADHRLLKTEAQADVAFIPFIQVDQPVNISVEQSTIEDPFWIAEPEGYSIISRPGLTTALDFPVVITTEIDGEVFLQNGDNTRRLAGVTIELVDKQTQKLVQTVRSEFDGFYLFQKVKAGEYYLRIAADDLDYYGAIQDYRIELILPQGSDIASNQNLYIVQKPQEEAQQDEAAATEEESTIQPSPIEAPSL